MKEFTRIKYDVFRMICDGDKCIVGFNQEFKVYTVKKGKSARFKKHDFNWTGCIGQPYGLVRVRPRIPRIFKWIFDSPNFSILRIFRFSEFVGSSNWWHCCIFRLTWLIEKRELKIENEKSSESISKILSNIDSALDNRNQNDTNKDSASMEEMRWVF